ncbi:SDR family NAD(P)-dependent oxidoreductase, partial [Saccharomonospora azurea]|uniref:SDR family NAD(P)-dependent oxidoreductase n=1 Tax=Saccharomonospora azurea TaxID=40988 RepID=UPI00240996EC
MTANRPRIGGDQRAALVRLLRELGLGAAGPQAERADALDERHGTTGGAEGTEGIAVIGLAGRYPGADTPEELWANLRAGRSSIAEVPQDRWDVDAHFDPSEADPVKSYSKWGGFLTDVDKFDPLLFQISPTVAENMDPQERLFLETVWSTLEDAGYPPRRLAEDNPVGVFAGLMNSNYEWIGGEASALGVHTDAHTDHWSVANRVSYVFDFTGPSLAVDTACSASLTAIHLACESIRRGECPVAVAGGVNLILHPKHLALYSRRSMISHGDRCRSFGSGADGFVAGEGAGAVLLKPLRHAVADGDRIYGILRGSSINAGGKTVGYTVPSPSAQAKVIEDALRAARIEPDRVGYVEAHGTGTPLGDPIEIAGLRTALSGQGSGETAAECPVGSVKSNIGHLESAAGIAGLTKVLMQLRHGQIAPSLYSEELNPEIDFSGSSLVVPQRLRDWPRPRDADGVELPRVAGVSSFGGGGANAHLVVEEYVPEADRAPTPDRGPQLVVLSARTSERLRVYAGKLADFLDDALAVDEALLARCRSECVRMASRVLHVAPEDVDPDVALTDLGADAAQQVALADLVRERFGVRVPGALGLSSPAELGDRIARRLTAEDPALSLADLAYTLQTGREAMAVRLAFVASGLAEARDRLRNYADGDDNGVDVGDKADREHRVAADELERAVADRDVAALGAHWVRGAVVDWSRLHEQPWPHRIALPTYPFARERYWIPDLPATARTTSSDVPAVSPQAGRAPDYYRPVWTPSTAEVTEFPDPRTAVSSRRVVILTGGRWPWLSERIAECHAHAGVVVLRADEEVDPSVLDTADHVYHLGGVGAGASLDEDLRTGVRSLLRTARRLHRTGQPRTLTVVTSDVYRPDGQGGTNPHAAACHGLTQVLPKEFAGLRAVAVDVSESDTATDQARSALARAVVAEPVSRTGRSVLLREGVRYTRALEQVTLADDGGPTFRADGVYLLVGGTGGIGMALSEHLARTHRAKLVWLSRGPLSAHHQQCVNRVRAAGGDVLHVRGDVARPGTVTEAVRRARERFGALHGVIHSAMSFDTRTLTELDDDGFREALAAKVDGSVALGEQLRHEPLDFVVFFSSIGAFAAAAGNGAYTTATTFEDAYALSAGLTCPVRVVNWGYWGQVGSGARPGLATLFADLGIEPFGTAHGVAAVEAILRSGVPQVVPISARPGALRALGWEPPSTAVEQSRLAAVAATLQRNRPADAEIDRIRQAYADLDDVCEDALLDAFRRMGVFHHEGERHERTALVRQLGIADRFARLTDALLNILIDAGYLAADGTAVRVLPAAATARTADAVAARFERLAAEHPDLRSTVTLTQSCLERYPDVLRGRRRATEIMFPDGSMERVRDFYRGNPLTDAFNDLMAETVREYLARTSPDAPVRIIELGAGTGATTDRVLPVVASAAHRVEYVFTDVSTLFLEHGEREFGGRHPFVR